MFEEYENKYTQLLLEIGDIQEGNTHESLIEALEKYNALLESLPIDEITLENALEMKVLKNSISLEMQNISSFLLWQELKKLKEKVEN